MHRSARRTATLVAVASLTLASGALAAPTLAPSDTASRSAISSPELRAKLNTLLQEHAYLAAGATGAALGGRQSEFQAAAGALDVSEQTFTSPAGLLNAVVASSAIS